MGRRNFTRPHRLHALNELNVTPLLDLCFCLLIIFMIATPVMEQSKRMDLPQSSSKQGGPGGKQPKSVVVAFTVDTLEFDGRTLSLDDLRAKFRDIAALDKDAQPVVRVRGDRRAAFERFAQIVDAFEGEHLTKLALDFKQ